MGAGGGHSRALGQKPWVQLGTAQGLNSQSLWTALSVCHSPIVPVFSSPRLVVKISKLRTSLIDRTESGAS